MRCTRECREVANSAALTGAAENSRETSAVRRFAAVTELGAELAALEGARGRAPAGVKQPASDNV